MLRYTSNLKRDTLLTETANDSLKMTHDSLERLIILDLPVHIFDDYEIVYSCLKLNIRIEIEYWFNWPYTSLMQYENFSLYVPHK